MPYGPRLYAARAAAGRCPRCGGVVDDKTFKLCSRCRKWMRANTRAHYAAMTEEQRAAHRERCNANAKRLYNDRRQQGLCAWCGVVKTNHWLCDDCAARRKMREMRKEGG